VIYAQSVPHHFNDKKDAYDVDALVTCHTNLGALSTEVDADHAHCVGCGGGREEFFCGAVGRSFDEIWRGKAERKGSASARDCED
jgi:hypothetical protein